MATKHLGGFEWDTEKASTNKRKHGVTFEEAVTAFRDDRGLVESDPQGHDDRFVLIGMSTRVRVLFVVHAEVINKKHTRIISARIASKREAMRYLNGDAL